MRGLVVTQVPVKDHLLTLVCHREERSVKNNCLDQETEVQLNCLPCIETELWIRRLQVITFLTPITHFS